MLLYALIMFVSVNRLVHRTPFHRCLGGRLLAPMHRPYLVRHSAPEPALSMRTIRIIYLCVQLQLCLFVRLLFFLKRSLLLDISKQLCSCEVGSANLAGILLFSFIESVIHRVLSPLTGFAANGLIDAGLYRGIPAFCGVGCYGTLEVFRMRPQTLRRSDSDVAVAKACQSIEHNRTQPITRCKNATDATMHAQVNQE